jgi:ADP-ribosylglycohydrolase
MAEGQRANSNLMKTIEASVRLHQRFVGLLLGTAVGDALGLPAENLSPERIRRRWPGPVQMRLVFGRGMISDDTEHTLMVAQALLSHPDDPVAFQRALAWKLRWWFAALPGGVGLATAKACLRLWIGFPPSKSAVVSAGSGPAMRSAVVGAFFASEPERRREFVLASSRLTHRGWQAETAALAVAEAAALAARSEGALEIGRALSIMRSLSPEKEWQTRVSQIESCLKAADSVSDFVRILGLKGGVTGYSLHVVPVALYVWLRHAGDVRTALASAIECGGDTDTVGAIAGALCGTTAGAEAIPAKWGDRIWEWPRSRKFMEHLAKRLADQKTSNTPLGPLRYCWPGLVPRNLLFLAVVLAHGVRRLAPPY